MHIMALASALPCALWCWQSHCYALWGARKRTVVRPGPQASALPPTVALVGTLTRALRRRKAQCNALYGAGRRADAHFVYCRARFGTSRISAAHYVALAGALP